MDKVIQNTSQVSHVMINRSPRVILVNFSLLKFFQEADSDITDTYACFEIFKPVSGIP